MLEGAAAFSVATSSGSPSGYPAHRGPAGALGNSPCGLKHPSLVSPSGPRCSASPSRPRPRMPQPRIELGSRKSLSRHSGQASGASASRNPETTPTPATVACPFSWIPDKRYALSGMTNGGCYAAFPDDQGWVLCGLPGPRNEATVSHRRLPLRGPGSALRFGRDDGCRCFPYSHSGQASGASASRNPETTPTPATVVCPFFWIPDKRYALSGMTDGGCYAAFPDDQWWVLCGLPGPRQRSHRFTPQATFARSRLCTSLRPGRREHDENVSAYSAALRSLRFGSGIPGRIFNRSVAG